MKALLVALFCLLVFTECTKDKERISVMGGWKCEEASEIAGLRTYQVNILRYQNDSARYSIYNFHNMGDSESEIVVCDMNEEGNLIIDNQIIVSHSAVISQGVGVVADDYSSITWTYYYSDPYISNEKVRATYY